MNLDKKEKVLLKTLWATGIAYFLVIPNLAELLGTTFSPLINIIIGIIVIAAIFLLT